MIKLEGKVVLTETDGRDSKWSKAFAKVLERATGKRWDEEGWDDTAKGWDLNFSSMAYRLQLKFSDGNFGYVLTSFRLALIGGREAVNVTRVFRNQRDLLQHLNDAIKQLDAKTSAKAAPMNYVLAMGLTFEDGIVELPPELDAHYPRGFDPNETEAQYLIATRQFQAIANSNAVEEMVTLKKRMLTYWQDGYYPPFYALLNLSTGKIVETRVSSESRGFLGTFNGERFLLNERLLRTLKVKLPAGSQIAASVEDELDDPTVITSSFDWQETRALLGLNQREFRNIRLMAAQILADSSYAGINDIMQDGSSNLPESERKYLSKQGTIR